ncbi:MAG: hypothetical protein IPK66_08915 [Rhodospirillales bacterium]|nr:hypothetical protein [Rhodospirillales bacterium]
MRAGFGGQRVPGSAAGVGDGVIVSEDERREEALAQVGPEAFDPIEFDE